MGSVGEESPTTRCSPLPFFCWPPSVWSWEKLTPGQLVTRPSVTEATEVTVGMLVTVGMVLDMAVMEAMAMVDMGVAMAPWALPVDMVAMPGQVDMWLQILGRSTLQRGLLSQNPNMQLATLAWVGTGLGSEATLPWDTLCLLTLPWATPPATQGHMGFTTAMEATVDSTEAPTMAKQIINSSHSIQFYKKEK